MCVSAETQLDSVESSSLQAAPPCEVQQTFSLHFPIRSGCSLPHPFRKGVVAAPPKSSLIGDWAPPIGIKNSRPRTQWRLKWVSRHTPLRL
ncbi:hypothetical protein Y1Q_0022077 [Alligator mississippiensis]|uniref:Uncharacterized protein n=1 Tax=Alligator mississippiensis TaxID=8496 RepID=A0A151NTQ7_ALLMI|nr:hypothetical protein Y1Q_0022077 [Alligator mississippiensis]